jgi:hypothetical protein
MTCSISDKIRSITYFGLRSNMNLRIENCQIGKGDKLSSCKKMIIFLFNIYLKLYGMLFLLIEMSVFVYRYRQKQTLFNSSPSCLYKNFLLKHHSTLLELKLLLRRKKSINKYTNTDYNSNKHN